MVIPQQIKQIYQARQICEVKNKTSQKKFRHYINKHKSIRILGISTSIALIFLIAFSVFPVISHQESVEATAGVEEIPTITITSASNSASVDITPISSTGTFAVSDSSSQLAFSVSTSNYTGYMLTIKGSDNLGQLTNARGDTLDSITTATDANTFATGDVDTYVNKWGYRPSSLCTNSAISTCTTNTNFLPAPTTSVTTLDITSSANPTTANNYTIDLAARVDYTKPVGTYTNTYILTATANPVAYAINYYTVNGTYNSSTKKMGFTKVGNTQSSPTNTAASVTLAPTATPTRSTYTLAGWCKSNTNHNQVSVNDGVTTTYNSGNTKITAYHDPGTVCNGTIYATGASMPIDPTIDNTNINLYAVWTPTTFDQAYAAASKTKATVGSNSYYKMQDMTASICSAVSPMQSTILFDYRKNVPGADGTSTSGQVNGTPYHIAKLPDGRCWMLDNLYLNLNNQNVVNDLKAIGTTGANTNTTTAAINALKNGGGTDSNGLAQTKLDYANWGSTNSYTKATVNRAGTCDSTKNSFYPCITPPSGVTSGYKDNNYTYNTLIDRFCMNADGTICEDETDVANTYNNYGLGNYKIGNYYNFCAASAGSYCYTNTDTTHTSNAGYDICPTGWRLPRSGTITHPTANYNEFQYLYSKISEVSSTPGNSTKALSMQTMLSMPLSGSYAGPTTAGRQGTYGYLRSSTYTNETTMYYFVANGKSVSTENSYSDRGRQVGLSVRCIVK